jgi:transmembrane sensor
MNRIAEFPDLSQAREEAALWIARMDRGLAAVERQAFNEWVRNPANARALRQLSGTWEGMDTLQALAEVFPEMPAMAQPAPRRAQRWRGAIAAALVLGMMLAGAAVWWRSSGAPAGTQSVATRGATTYAVPVGERRDVPLADGSTLTINSGSAVQVLSLAGKSRELQLLQGEALFTVAHDAARPFRVKAGSHMVEAVGTAFDVRLRSDGGVDVLVTDGRVRLMADGKAAGMLARGEAMRIGADGRMVRSSLDAEALMARLAWRHGMLVFDGEPLSTVLEEFSRYTDARFVIVDPQLRSLRIGGYFPAGDTGFLIETLHGSFGLQATRTPDGVIRVAPDH